MPDQPLVLLDVHLATMANDRDYGIVLDAALVITDATIAWLGARELLPKKWAAEQILSCKGCWLTPGLIDCHTHLVYVGNRAAEFEQRLHGATYEQIAASGGGILSTVQATRAASEAELYQQAEKRLKNMLAEGITTLEIKSGYGLDTDNEMKMLRVARRLGEHHPVTVRTTFLGAHALPMEFTGRADQYIELVCDDMLPRLVGENLVDAVDVFCENIAFTPEQTRRVFNTAKRYGLPVKLHADQLSDQHGAALAAEYHALSADHLEYTNEAGVAALAQAGTVAVLLPGAFYFLRERQLPPIEMLRKYRVPMAIATDCNPGSSPVTSLLLMLNMACTLFRLTPAEALAGVTCHAARALGLTAQCGSLQVGQRADLALWDIHSPAELTYAIGANPCVGVIQNGRQVFWDIA